MDDRQIIELYNERSETAISETADKYGKYCYTIAYHILYNEQDSEECVPASGSTEQAVEEKLLVEVLNRFLHELPIEKRMMFLRRYWYMSSIKEIAEDYEISEGNVKMTLLRIRNKLKQTLEKEGIVL